MERRENEPQPKDISSEFKDMDVDEFINFLRSQRKEPALSVVVDWVDVFTARRLKAFLEGSTKEQRRFASIRATREEMEREKNVFNSGVKWIEK